MTQEYEADLSVGPYSFRASVCLPLTTAIDSSSPTSLNRFFASYQVGQGAGGAWVGLFIAFESGSWLRVLLYSCEGMDVGSAVDRLDETMMDGLFPADERSRVSPDCVLDDLQRYALRNDTLVSAALLVLDASDEDMHGSESFATATVFMAGLPPAVLVENGHYHFPVRSGIPLGIRNIQARSQTIEISPRSSLILHTPLGGAGDRLLQFHRGLSHFKPAGLPSDVILFRLSLK